MFSHFANIAGFWALLGIPVVLFIHFLQQRSRKLKTSTLFLMDALPPESSTGRVLDRIRSSRSLWLQLLAVLLCAWVLSEPRFVRENSSQTVAIVLDDSATMRVFREAARQAALAVVSDYEGKAQQTHWIVMGSSPRNEAFYRGTEAVLAREAIGRWMPGSGTHDVSGALKLAGNLTDRNGYSWFITDKEGKCPVNQAAIGVGRPLPNVGFVGAVESKQNGISGWRIAVKNNAGIPQERPWSVHVDGALQETKQMSLEPGAINEFFVAFPSGAKEMILSLQGDEFALDDVLPLVRPEPKKLKASIEVKGKTAEFFRKLLASMNGIEIVPAEQAQLRIVASDSGEASPLPAGKPPTVSILAMASPSAERENLSLGPIVPESTSLLEGLNWSGLLSSGPVRKQATEGAQILLWQGDLPLAWKEGSSLVVNWDWEMSNSSRLPSFVLLIRRYVESVRGLQPGSFAENVPLGTRLNLAAADRMEWTSVREGKKWDQEKKSYTLSIPCRAPVEPGFFRIFKGEEEVMRGSTCFDDVREGDFSECSQFVHELPPSVRERREKLSLPDPLVPMWLTGIILALTGAWWPARRKMS